LLLLGLLLSDESRKKVATRKSCSKGKRHQPCWCGLVTIGLIALTALITASSTAQTELVLYLQCVDQLLVVSLRDRNADRKEQE